MIQANRGKLIGKDDNGLNVWKLGANTLDQWKLINIDQQNAVAGMIDNPGNLLRELSKGSFTFLMRRWRHLPCLVPLTGFLAGIRQMVRCRSKPLASTSQTFSLVG
jgi:hypothetical protein